MDAFRLRPVALLSVIFLTATPLQAQPPSAELASILGKWQLAVSEPRRYEIRGHRIVYNDVFETEKWSDITINYEAPHSIRFEIQPADIPAGIKSKRVSEQTGRAYRIEADGASLWLWMAGNCINGSPGTGRQIGMNSQTQLQINQKLQNPDVPPPPAMPEDPPQVWSFFWPLFSPEIRWPSLLAVDAPGFFDEFDWTVTHKANSTILFEGKPRPKKYRVHFQHLFVIVDKATGRPLAEKTIDPSGNISIVTTYEEWNLQPGPFRKDEDLRSWNYEEYSLPEELPVLKHRRTK
jgi:hypothetical protein